MSTNLKNDLIFAALGFMTCFIWLSHYKKSNIAKFSIDSIPRSFRVFDVPRTHAIHKILTSVSILKLWDDIANTSLKSLSKGQVHLSFGIEFNSIGRFIS